MLYTMGREASRQYFYKIRCLQARFKHIDDLIGIGISPRLTLIVQDVLTVATGSKSFHIEACICLHHIDNNPAFPPGG